MAEYCTLAELRDLGLNPDAFVEMPAPKRHQAIASRSTFIDGFLGRFTLPLVTWGDDIKRCCAVLASIDLIRNRGIGPDDSLDFDTIEKRQIDWLKLVSQGTVTPQVTDSSPGATVGRPARRTRVISGSSRGFSVRGTGLPRGPFQGD
jgi:phage gp36-like protein